MTATLCIDGCFAQLGEGPSWHERLRTLFWVDMAGGKLFSFNPSTSVTKQFYIGRRITSVHPVNGQTNGVLLVFNNSIEYFGKWLNPKKYLKEDSHINHGQIDTQFIF